MDDSKKKRYIYLMLAGFGAISLSVILFFVLYRMQGIGAYLKNIYSILVPFVYGGVVAYLLRPICNAYERFLEKHLPKGMKSAAPGLAVACSLLTGLLLVYALAAMIIPRVLESLTTLAKAIPSKLETFSVWMDETFGENQYVDNVLSYFNTSYDKLYDEVDVWLRDDLLPQLQALITSLGSSIYNVAISIYNLVIGLIVAVYMLASRKRFARQGTLIVRSLFNEKWANAVLNEISLVDRMFGGFIDGKLLDSLIVGVLCYFGCLILQIPNTLLISVFVGVSNVIPFFGPLIGAVPSTLLILIEDPLKAVWFVIFILALQQVDGNIIDPAIVGNRTGISGFWVMFAIIFFGGLWGVTGMIIGVPLFGVIYDLIRKFVKVGLNKHGKMDLWEQYAADYPNEDEPKTEGSQLIQWNWDEAKRGANKLWKKLCGGLQTLWIWLKALWALLRKAAAWCAASVGQTQKASGAKDSKKNKK